MDQTTVPSTPPARRGFGAYGCYLCRRELNEGALLFNDQLASVMIYCGRADDPRTRRRFAAACDRHAGCALERALSPLVRADRRPPKDWVITVYRVEVDGLEPRLGRTLFVARRRTIATAEAA